LGTSGTFGNIKNSCEHQEQHLETSETFLKIENNIWELWEHPEHLGTSGTFRNIENNIWDHQEHLRTSRIVVNIKNNIWELRKQTIFGIIGNILEHQEHL
jgi:hypothetical protein